MPAVLGALVLSVLLAGLGDLLFNRWTKDLDPALRIGLGALLGLGVFGFAVWFACFVHIGAPRTVATYFTYLFGGLGAFGLWRLRNELKFVAPRSLNLLFPIAIGLAVLMAWIAAAGPSDSLDWDSLAYHLAVPKIWLANNAMVPISYIHHSNFPFLVDSLFIVGLALGGAAMAKGFMVAFLLWGAVAAFGFARQQWGGNSGWWAALAFAGIPTVFWESGTAYIDVAHGLYAGLGMLFVARWIGDSSRKNELVLGATLLGCGAASKYTGLQTVVACVFVLGLYGLFKKQVAGSVKAAVLVGILGIGIASPWLIKNAMWTGNPVYPFFYEKLGGKNWDQFSADIYREEQQSFGVGLKATGGRDATQIGHAILGLAYQPGRYNNPRQTEGGGFPIGALGIVPFAGAIAWLFSGRLRREESATLAIIGISFLFWFFLSQQSRYLLNLGIPLAILAGGAAANLRLKPLIGTLIVGQFAYSAWLVNTLSVSLKLPVVLGQKSIEDYHRENGPGFFFGAKAIDALSDTYKARVALYDEVFGFYLNRPYFWANPGHSTEIGYAQLDNGPALAAKLREMGFLHVYLSLAFQSPEQRDRWAQAAGLVPDGAPYEGEERVGLTADLRNKWRVLLAEAARSGNLVLVDQSPGGLIFEVK